MATFPRVAGGAVGSALTAFGLNIALSYVDRTIGLLIASAVFVVGLFFVVTARASAIRRGFRGVATMVAAVTLATPVVLDLFVHLNSERYLWVIRQPGTCSYFGSAAILFSSLAIGVSMGVGSVGLLVATKGRGDHLCPRLGLFGGAVVVGLAVVIAIAAPDLAAVVLGCRPTR